MSKNLHQMQSVLHHHGRSLDLLNQMVYPLPWHALMECTALAKQGVDFGRREIIIRFD